jgi:hypothetical protein
VSSEERHSYALAACKISAACCSALAGSCRTSSSLDELAVYNHCEDVLLATVRIIVTL